MKSECPTYLKSKGKAMAITLSDGEVSDDELECDEDGNFIAFTATAVVNESISAEENPFDRELSKDVDLQEAYNKLCKVAAKDESKCDEDGNFIAFTATTVVNESISAEENPSDEELSEDADLQEAYNKLCKVAAKDVMNVELGLKKIESLELDKKNLLVKLFDANELLNNVKTKNMLLLDKVKSLELDLSVARSASFKLDQ